MICKVAMKRSQTLHSRNGLLSWTDALQLSGQQLMRCNSFWANPVLHHCPMRITGPASIVCFCWLHEFMTVAINAGVGDMAVGTPSLGARQDPHGHPWSTCLGHPCSKRGFHSGCRSHTTGHVFDTVQDDRHRCNQIDGAARGKMHV